MRTQFYTATTLDGFLATPDDDLGWLMRFDPGDGGYEAFIRDVGALCMGAATYEWVRRELERTGEPWPYDQPAWVFTHRDLPAIPGADVRFVRGDVAPVHAEMAAAADGRNVWVVGGGDLAGQFYDAGLLDELILQVAPVTLGAGKPLFPRTVTNGLRLVEARQAGEMVALRYEVERGSPSNCLAMTSPWISLVPSQIEGPSAPFATPGARRSLRSATQPRQPSS